jgi:uncharacterized membrane protein YfcA
VTLSWLLPIIFAYSIVQSLFGVGLLVFGTPTLLLLGVPFEQALGLLLPCSITVNLLQLVSHWRLVTLKREFVVNFVPFVGLGLAIVLLVRLPFHPRTAVGVLLLLTALMRLSGRLMQAAQRTFKQGLWVFLPSVGLTHGLTNMGGGLLTILVSGLFRDKDKIRANVAFGYLIMALSQCAVLVCVRHQVFVGESAVLAAVAGMTYVSLGNRAFEVISNRAYQLALTTFILVFGVALLR